MIDYYYFNNLNNFIYKPVLLADSESVIMIPSFLACSSNDWIMLSGNTGTMLNLSLFESNSDSLSL